MLLYFEVDFRWSAAEGILRCFLADKQSVHPPIPLHVVQSSLRVVGCKLRWLLQLREETAPDEASELPSGMADHEWESILRVACGAPPPAVSGPPYNVTPEDDALDRVALTQEAREMVTRLDQSLWCRQAKLADEGNIWILKPASKSRGRGILVFNSLLKMERHLCGTNAHHHQLSHPYLQAEANIMSRLLTSAEPHIVQRYIERPLLIQGRKFDVRVWVLVTSWVPLEVWAYQDSYVRFSANPYDTDTTGNQAKLFPLLPF